MKLLHNLEKRWGRFAISGLMTYIIGLNGLVFILALFHTPGAVVSALRFNPALIAQGQWWRLVTFVMIPPTFSPLFLVFSLYFYYMIGQALESEWGTFRFNAYYFIGVTATVITALIFHTEATITYINLSLFLAFARLFPDFRLLFFFILPIKIKYLAWLNWFYIGYTILFQPFLALKVAAATAILNYLIFFGREIQTNTIHRRQIHQNRRRFLDQIKPFDAPMHKCVICHRTERDDPKLEFRYCAKCAGDYEYCMDHLHTHQHIQAGEAQPSSGPHQPQN